MKWGIYSLMSRTMPDNLGGQFDPALDEWKTEVVDLPDDFETAKAWALSRNPSAFSVRLERLPNYVNPLDRLIPPKV